MATPDVVVAVTTNTNLSLNDQEIFRAKVYVQMFRKPSPQLNVAVAFPFDSQDQEYGKARIGTLKQILT